MVLRGFDVISVTDHLHEESVVGNDVNGDGSTYSLSRNTFDRYLEDLKEAARYGNE